MVKTRRDPKELRQITIHLFDEFCGQFSKFENDKKEINEVFDTADANERYASDQFSMHINSYSERSNDGINLYNPEPTLGINQYGAGIPIARSVIPPPVPPSLTTKAQNSCNSQGKVSFIEYQSGCKPKIISDNGPPAHHQKKPISICPITPVFGRGRPPVSEEVLVAQGASKTESGSSISESEDDDLTVTKRSQISSASSVSDDDEETKEQVVEELISIGDKIQEKYFSSKFIEIESKVLQMFIGQMPSYENFAVSINNLLGADRDAQTFVLTMYLGHRVLSKANQYVSRATDYFREFIGEAFVEEVGEQENIADYVRRNDIN